MGLEHEALTEQIIGAAIAVHKKLGPGFLESIYENALIVELQRRQLHVERQVELTVLYEGVEVGKHRADLIVEHTIVVELKAISQFGDIHYATLRSYLKAADKQHGLLINFAAVTLQVKRVRTAV
ncbi:MAG: GxxExxY protein [Phycisphaeraceae bacterium]|nr:GxxExxY protein [Phycisphaeraceae bacterium]